MPLFCCCRVAPAGALAVVLSLLSLSVPAQRSSTPPAQQAAWLAANRASVRQALDVPAVLPALDARVWGSFSTFDDTVQVTHVTYATADGMVVPAVVYRPTAAALRAAHVAVGSRLPGIVIVCGHGNDKFGWYAMYSGLLFARAGAVVVTYDTIGEGERNAERRSMNSPSPHDADVTPPAPLPHDDWGRRLAGLMQVDLAQAVSYLRAQPDVDPTRIATAGYSLGSLVVGLEGAWDTRVHAVLLSAGGDFDGAGGYFDSNKLPCTGPPYRALNVLNANAATQAALAGFPETGAPGVPPYNARGPVIYALNAARGSTLLMNGDADTVMDIPHHDAAWFAGLRQRTLALTGPAAAVNGRPMAPGDRVFTTIFFPAISHRPSWVTRDGVLWLNEQLHFAILNTPARIDAAGTTHIGPWLDAHGIVQTKRYVMEDREGGLRAVGTEFPALTRAQLTVLPDAEWQRLEPQLTYAAWAAKTLAAEQRAAASAAR